MHSLPHPPLAEPLAYRLGSDADASQIAAAVGTLCDEIERALAPIVGRRGVEALFERSLQLAMALDAPATEGGGAGVVQLRQHGLQRHRVRAGLDRAAALAGAFLTEFQSLLASLVGPALTERLLRPVWPPPAGDPPAQELP